MGSTIREARLRVEFASLYPPLAPGEWIPAAEAGARMIFHVWTRTAELDLEARVLHEEHFDFRGGWDRGKPAGLRTRAGDVEPAYPEPVRRRAVGG